MLQSTVKDFIPESHLTYFVALWNKGRVVVITSFVWAQVELTQTWKYYLSKRPFLPVTFTCQAVFFYADTKQEFPRFIFVSLFTCKYIHLGSN